MIDLPEHVADVILNVMTEGRAPGYFLVSREGCVLRQGGALSAYGLADVAPGNRITEPATAFLCGLLPLRDANLFLPKVEIGAGALADIYLVRGELGDWVLLLEASAEERKYRRLLQKANELNLLREEFGKALAIQPLGGDALAQIERVSGLDRRGECRRLAVSCTTLPSGPELDDEPGHTLAALDALYRVHRRVVEQQAGVVLASAGPVLTALYGLLPAEGPAARLAVAAARTILEDADQASDLAIGIATGPIAVGLRDGCVRASGRALDRAWELARQASGARVLIDQDTLADCGDLRERFTPASAPGGAEVFASIGI